MLSAAAAQPGVRVGMSPEGNGILRRAITAALLAYILLAPSLAQAKRQQLAETNDWQTAVRIVQRAYPGSSGWLLSCSASEGGHGRFVMNYGGSGAGGWMQYLSGTFWTDYRSAVVDLLRRGWKPPASSASWYSPLGQAIAGGWAYEHSRPSGKWTGGGC